MVYARYIAFVSQLDSVDTIDELPGALLRALKDMGMEVGLRILTEDEGWAVTFRHHGIDYRFWSRFDMASEPLECMGWVELNRGFVASWFGSRETYEHRAVEPIIQSALARLPAVREPVWHSGDDEDSTTSAA